MKNERIRRMIISELASREIREHAGRWCEITMKESKRVFRIVRTGYGPMERPEMDPHVIEENDKVVAECDSLYAVAEWILNNNEMTSSCQNEGCIDRKIVRETAKAYLVEQVVNNRRDGWHINFRWVAKSICKPCGRRGYIAVPEWAVSNGVW